MLRFSKGLISIILFCTIILLGYINNSYADIEIESVEVFPYANSYGTFTLYVYVQTSEPYVEINYYLDDTWIGAHSGGNGLTDDHFWYDDYSYQGSVKGKKHKLKVDVWRRDNDGSYPQDTEIKKFRVYQPIVTSGYGRTEWEKPRNTGAIGWAEVSAHYFNGTDFVMEASASFYNDSDVTLSAEAWFRQNEYILTDLALGTLTKSDEHRDTKPKLNYEPGDRDSWSPNSGVVNYSLGRLIKDRETFYYDAHTHLQVRTVEAGIQVQDDWEADTGIQTFTKDDNP